MIITIDGPAGTGKTTVACNVAEKLGFSYFDTGAMYRALTYLFLEEKIGLQNTEEIKKCLNHFSFDIKDKEGKKHYFIDSEDVTEKIRSQEVTEAVSEVASLGEVRKALVAIQQEFGKGKNAVFEGRDMGTVVFPHAEYKFYLDALPSVRALRRYQELKEKNMLTSEKEVFENIMTRDYYDSNRDISPLRRAEDAHLIDTSDMAIDEVIERVLSLIKI